MECQYSLSFEFETQQPITVKGIARANTLRTVMARAVDDATAKFPNMSWASVVVCIERNKPNQGA